MRVPETDTAVPRCGVRRGPAVAVGGARRRLKRNLAVSKTAAAATKQRVALVIGNGAPTNPAPLANPVNDARAISAKLRTLGFEVIERQNLTQKQVGGVLREFRSSSSPAAWRCFSTPATVFR